MIEQESVKTLTVNGIIIPVKWDKNGNITGLALAGFDETNYPIVMNRTGKSLLALMNEKVVITGDIIKEHNIEMIKVSSFG